RFSRDWSSDVCSSDLIIARPILNGAATLNVEGVVHAVAHGLGGGVFQQARDHRRALAFVDHGRSEAACGLKGIGALDHFAERFEIGRASCRERGYSAG